MAQTVGQSSVSIVSADRPNPESNANTTTKKNDYLVVSDEKRCEIQHVILFRYEERKSKKTIHSMYFWAFVYVILLAWIAGGTRLSRIFK